MDKRFKDFIIWLHIIEVTFVWLTPFLFSWYLIVLGILLNYIQELLLGGCVLTIMQFGKKNKKAFYTFILEKIGYRPNNEKVIFFVNHIKPLILLGIALIWQILLKNVPLIF